jgi:hypothetical protein
MGKIAQIEFFFEISKSAILGKKWPFFIKN